MSEFSVPYTFTAGTKAKASEVNANFTACKTAIDGHTGDIEEINASFANAVLKDGSINFEKLQSYKKRTVTSATNASPIVITSTLHGFSTGDLVYISGVSGNTSANGKWTITKVSNDTFSLDSSVGNGAYTSGGFAYLLPNVNESLAPKKYVDINASRVITQIGTCSTASSTIEKAVALEGFELQVGATILVAFANANTVNVPTLNVNSTGVKAIYNESGVAVNINNPAFFPAGSTVEFIYDGTNWIFKKRKLSDYVNGTSWYRQWTDGWLEQGGYSPVASTTITFLKAFKDTNYYINTQPNVASGVGLSNGVGNKTACSIQVYGGQIFYWEAKGY